MNQSRSDAEGITEGSQGLSAATPLESESRPGTLKAVPETSPKPESTSLLASLQDAGNF
ncbi:MAG: hypothetical protein ACAI34_06220 [Verrucomicrobium sp.]